MEPGERGAPQDVGLRPRGDLAARASARTLLVRGDDTGATTRLVYVDRDRIGVFGEWSRLVTALDRERLRRLDPAGCQFLLAYGLVPPPYTVYRNVFALGVGDRLEVALDGSRLAFKVDYPYFEARSRGDGRVEPAQLRRLLGEAVLRAIATDEPALLMQSAGKDSAGLLLGIAEAGRRNVRAVTYDARYREREAGPARALARHCGVPHEVVETDPRAEIGAYLRFAETAPALCADLTLFPYLLALERTAVAGGVVLDGLGNDGYMGYVVPRRDALLARLALARRVPALWGRLEPPALGARAAYLWKTAQMVPAERCLAGSRLAPASVRRLIPVDSPFSSHFAALDRARRGLAPLDFRSYVRARIFDGAMTMPKGRLAAASRGARAVFPYCDPALIDACFHLPRAERYDLRTRTNKLPLRRLLAAELGPSPYLRAKGSFRFDAVGFVAANLERIRAEIERARPLLRGLDRTAGFLLGRRANYVHAYEATTLFMVAAWLARLPAEVVRPLAEGAPAGSDCDLEIEL
jgi:asparagine synthase (glutamine-hydrolysing)